MLRIACKVGPVSISGPRNVQNGAVETHALMFEIADLI